MFSLIHGLVYCLTRLIEVDSVKMGENYREYLSQGHDLLGNSQRILEKLAPHYDLYIVTNGVAKTQYRRLEDSKLMPYFKDIFVSEKWVIKTDERVF